MAEHADNLAKSTAFAPPALRCRYLFHSHFPDHGPGTVPAHVHPFWHVDCFFAGQAVLETLEGTVEMGPGVNVIIPAGVRHGFRYLSDRSSWLSIKADVEGHPPLDHARAAPSSSAAASVVGSLRELLPADQPPPRMVREVAGHLVAALLTAGMARPRSQPASLRAQVERILTARHGRPLTVAEAAETLGYSASHLSGRFRREEGMAIKTFIDRTRASLACQRLVYDDRSVTAVAAAMGFADIYAFSRFFKRVCGQSPTEFRRGGMAGVSQGSGASST